MCIHKFTISIAECAAKNKRAGCGTAELVAVALEVLKRVQLDFSEYLRMTVLSGPAGFFGVPQNDG